MAAAARTSAALHKAATRARPAHSTPKIKQDIRVKAMVTCARRQVAFPPAPCHGCAVGVQVRHKLHATCHGPNFRRRSPPATLVGNNQAGSHPTRMRNLGCIALFRQCFPAPQWAVPGERISLCMYCTVAGRAGSTQDTMQDPTTAGGLQPAFGVTGTGGPMLKSVPMPGTAWQLRLAVLTSGAAGDTESRKAHRLHVLQLAPPGPCWASHLSHR